MTKLLRTPVHVAMIELFEDLLAASERLDAHGDKQPFDQTCLRLEQHYREIKAVLDADEQAPPEALEKFVQLGRRMVRLCAMR